MLSFKVKLLNFKKGQFGNFNDCKSKIETFVIYHVCFVNESVCMLLFTELEIKKQIGGYSSLLSQALKPETMV